MKCLISLERPRRCPNLVVEREIGDVGDDGIGLLKLAALSRGVFGEAERPGEAGGLRKRRGTVVEDAGLTGSIGLRGVWKECIGGDASTGELCNGDDSLVSSACMVEDGLSIGDDGRLSGNGSEAGSVRDSGPIVTEVSDSSGASTGAGPPTVKIEAGGRSCS